MAYKEGETLLLAQVQAATGYSSANTSTGNWRIINYKGMPNYAIIRPEATPKNRWFGAGCVINYWRSTVEIWQKYVDDGSTAISLKATVAAVQARLDLYPHLQDTTNTITDAANLGVSAILRQPATGPIHWLIQELTVEWQEKIPLVYLE